MSKKNRNQDVELLDEELVPAEKPKKKKTLERKQERRQKRKHENKS